MDSSRGRVVHNSYDTATSAEEETTLRCPRAIHLWTIIDTRLISEALLLRLVDKENRELLCINQTVSSPLCFDDPFCSTNRNFPPQTTHVSTCSLAKRILGWVGLG